MKTTGNEALAQRASDKLRADELLVRGLGVVRLKTELDRVPLWRGNHVSVRQLLDVLSGQFLVSSAGLTPRQVPTRNLRFEVDLPANQLGPGLAAAAGLKAPLPGLKRARGFVLHAAWG